MSFRYTKSETDQSSPLARDNYTRTNESFLYSVSHTANSSSRTRFDFERDDITNERSGRSLTTTRDMYRLFNRLYFGTSRQHRLNSSFRFFDISSGSGKRRNWWWRERMRLSHSRNLFSYYRFQLRDTDEEAGAKQTFGEMGFQHRLYESLTTDARIFSQFTEPADTETQGGELRFTYEKTNPWGTLYGTYNVILTRVEQSGGGGVGSVVDEQHTFDVNDLTPIELDRRNIDPCTIVVADSFGIPYDEFFDYEIFQTDGATRITVVVGGDIYNDAVANGGTADLFISYSFFIEPEQESDVCTQGLSVRQRFDNGLVLYYRHQRRDEQISSNVTGIAPDEFRNNTYGAEYRKEGLSLKGEYVKRDSTQISTTQKLLSANYGWAVNAETTALVRVQGRWNEFGGSTPHDMTVYTLGGTLTSRLTDNYSLLGRVDYYDQDDTVFRDTKGIQFDIGLRYAYRQLRAGTGIEFDMLDHDGDERINTFFYFRLKRMF
jgi:hypothetical protein